MKSWSQEPEADDRSSQPEEGLLDVRESVKSSAKPTKGMQPRDGPLDEPAIDSQAATVLGVAFGQHRSDSHPAQETPNRFRVKAAISLEAIGFLPIRPRLAADRRHAGHYVEKFLDLVDVGSRHGDGQGNAVGVGHHVMLAARFAAIRGIWASIVASFRRLGERASISARRQSMWSAALSSANKRACSLSQTPASCQSCR